MSLEELGELPLVSDGRSRFPSPCSSPTSPSPSTSSTSPAATAKMVSVSPGPTTPVLILVSSLAALTAATSPAHGGMGLGIAARVDFDMLKFSVSKIALTFKPACAMDRVPLDGSGPGGGKTQVKIALLKTQRRRGGGSRQHGGASGSQRGGDGRKSPGKSEASRFGLSAEAEDLLDVVDPPLDELGLDAEALRLEAEMLRLRDQHFTLAKRAEEVKARKDASAELHNFELELREELSGMIQSLQDEKREKLRAAQAFEREIKGRISELDGVLNQLASKVNGVNAMYDATAAEVRRYVNS